MNKKIVVVGFMLFAIFFGAGNLIFPPKLGFISGEFFWPAIIGFIVTGVGIPLITIIAGAFDEGGYKAALKNVHPVFGVIFLIAIYLTIGPLFAIPRTGATSYEMALVPFIGGPSKLSLFLFTLVYFGISLWLAINPSKMVDRVGAILTPVLLVSVVLLVIRGIFIFSGNASTPTDTETFTSGTGSFFTGFTEGYLTMDAIAAIAFSVIVLNAVKDKGFTKETGLLKPTMLAALIAAGALGFIYLTLGWMGNHYPLSGEQLAFIDKNGLDIRTYLLTHMANDAFGGFGKVLIGVIVTLACLTTSIGLIVAVSEYFYEIFPKISYKVYVVIFTLFSLLLANQGLQQVIATSVPVLMVLYPIGMTLVLLVILSKFIPTPRLSYQIAMAFVTIIAVLSVLSSKDVGLLQFPLMNHLPLKAQSMEWLLFALAGYVLGLIFGAKQPKIKFN
ncbi:branched-chain amino acid transport system II carrier protein [Macrococcus brunensis]|uniref:Branched-chain amino acid transport system carrier protein n=1 Tax=Macrococcus brunensis TaxID=198483 RepID=A0A4R6BCJ5_9STAP|nr:branched-chain amino acid transport system II carrier protein [Macrococcus brunensis]TDL95590.1 branched-chain amino acid transport system II carrier protein [Macrococcus brunensis]ULG73302.1 branched-chain amino acid transport system II carrier protein [Macrococcus brunensis]